MACIPLHKYRSTEVNVIFNGLVIHMLFPKYTNERFYSCFDYVYKNSRKSYAIQRIRPKNLYYTTHPIAIAFMVSNTVSFNIIFTITIFTGRNY